jgi:hypothetical protein
MKRQLAQSFWIFLIAGFGFSVWSASHQTSADNAKPSQSEHNWGPEQQFRNPPVAPPAQSFTGAQQQDHAPATRQHSNWYSTFIEHPAEWVTASFTIMLAFYTRRLFRATQGLQDATVGLLKFAGEQASDMKASIDAARRSAGAAEIATKITLATQRAQLDILKYQTEVLGTDTLIGFIVRAFWKNFGNSFALNMDLNIQVVVLPRQQTADLTFIIKRRTVHEAPRANLAPGNEISTKVVPIRPNQAYDAWQKKMRIFVYTRATYNDVVELDGPKRQVIDACSEVLFLSDPKFLLLPSSGVGPLTTQMSRYSAYSVIDENETPGDGDNH